MLAKNRGKDAADAIRAGKAELAVKIAVQAGKQKRIMMQRAEQPDRVVYNKTGEAIYWYEGATHKVHKLETIPA